MIVYSLLGKILDLEVVYCLSYLELLVVDFRLWILERMVRDQDLNLF